MCGVSEFYLKNKKVFLNIGYRGGSLKYGNATCSHNGDKSEMIKELSKLSKKDLINMILEFVNNGEEL